MPGLWQLAASPLIWAGHFTVSYATAAIFCAKVAGRDGSLGGARAAIAAYTAAAVGAVALIGWRSYLRQRGEEARPALPHDTDSREGSQQFLAFATLILSGLSAVAILYAALAALFVGSCS